MYDATEKEILSEFFCSFRSWIAAIGWAIAFPTTNYIVQLTTEGSPGNDAVYITEKTATGFTLQSTNTAGAKINILINVAIFN